MTLIHIDRSGWIRNKKPLMLTRRIEFTHIYPEGISAHGEHYLFDKNDCPTYAFDKEIETIFEKVRQSFYPECLSRFQSLFAVDFNDVERLESEIETSANSRYYEVTSDYYEKRDMSLLINLEGNAHLYWQGRHSENPLFEYLLKPPVKIVKKIK